MGQECREKQIWGFPASRCEIPEGHEPETKDRDSRPVKFGEGDVPVNSWLRGGGEKAETNPCFMATPSGKDRSGAKKTPQSKQRIPGGK